MSECTHDCSSCAQNCSERTEENEFRAKLNNYSSVKKVIAVLSGKGGVGKSLVTGLMTVLSQRKGYKTAVMDADMQDPPALLEQMMEVLKQGEYDSVATRRVDRKGEPIIRSFFARQFYKWMKRISDVDVVDGARDFRLMNRKMVDAIVSMSENTRFSKGIFGWIGFKTYWLPYENVERVAGKTKWSFWKLLKYSLDGIVSFSDTPLKISSWSGLALTLISGIMLLVVFIRALIFGDAVAGWPSTICTILFVGGVQLFCIGVMGQYVAKIYKESKHRPQYIVGETNKQDVVK